MKGDRGLWLGVLLGAPLLLLGVKDVFDQASRTHPFELARWVVGAALVLDLVVLPVSLLVGRSIRGRPALRWAMSSSAITLLVAWPYVRGYGRSRGNPSLLPRDYGTGTSLAIAATVVAAGAWAVLATRRAHAQAKSSTGSVQPPPSPPSASAT